MGYLGKLLCWLGFHRTTSTPRGYYDEVKCSRCAYHKNVTEWDGWNP